MPTCPRWNRFVPLSLMPPTISSVSSSLSRSAPHLSHPRVPFLLLFLTIDWRRANGERRGGCVRGVSGDDGARGEETEAADAECGIRTWSLLEAVAGWRRSRADGQEPWGRYTHQVPLHASHTLLLLAYCPPTPRPCSRSPGLGSLLLAREVARLTAGNSSPG